jgi:hypothetical protein
MLRGKKSAHDSAEGYDAISKDYSQKTWAPSWASGRRRSKNFGQGAVGRHHQHDSSACGMNWPRGRRTSATLGVTRVVLSDTTARSLSSSASEDGGRARFGRGRTLGGPGSLRADERRIGAASSTLMSDVAGAVPRPRILGLRLTMPREALGGSGDELGGSETTRRAVLRPLDKEACVVDALADELETDR